MHGKDGRTLLGKSSTRARRTVLGAQTACMVRLNRSGDLPQISQACSVGPTWHSQAVSGTGHYMGIYGMACGIGTGTPCGCARCGMRPGLPAGLAVCVPVFFPPVCPPVLCAPCFSFVCTSSVCSCFSLLARLVRCLRVARDVHVPITGRASSFYVQKA